MGNTKLIGRKKRRPFTQLIRDSQFSAIGLVLLGESAKVRRILDGIGVASDNNNNNGSASLGGIIATGSATDDNNQRSRRGMEQSSLKEDVGERIQRHSSSKAGAGNDGGVIGPARSKKTRKIHVNEIDQLFEGLA